MRKVISRPQSAIKMTAFTKKVLSLVKKVPRGKVATYGQIAALAGKEHGARGVGWILNSCTDKHKLPWQRIINSRGKISFDRSTPEFVLQRKLLLKERIKFGEDGVIPLEKYQWSKRARKLRSLGRIKMFR
ncbi:MAG: MGMT family protein [Bdellovibrionota bacterium]